MKKMSKKKKRILIISSVIVAIILIILIVLATVKDNPENFTSVEQFKSIEDVIRYMGCTYIKQQKSKDTNFAEDVYVKFKVDLYEGETSNERFYNQLIELVTKVSNYESVRILDQERNITIAIQCNTNKKQIDKITINGIEDYFSKEDSKRALENKKEENITNLTIQAGQIKQAISSKWLPQSVSLGTKESEFEGEDIYFDEGIRIKNVSGRIFRMIFTKKYPYEVANGIKVGTSLEEIKRVLGDPTFDSQQTVIGYKTNEIYIFFSEEEITVYRVEEDKTEEIKQIIVQYAEDSDTKQLINELTSKWLDYDIYANNDIMFLLQYTLKGIKVQINSQGDKNGIHLYQNYKGQFTKEEQDELITSGNVFFDLEEDLVSNEEISRVRIQQDNLYYYEQFMKRVQGSEQIGNSNLFAYFLEKYDDGTINKVKFLSKDGKYPNTTLKDKVDTYVWKDDENFIYSILNEGIYLYNVANREKKVLIEGDQPFKIKELKENILKYDDNIARLNF